MATLEKFLGSVLNRVNRSKVRSETPKVTDNDKLESDMQELLKKSWEDELKSIGFLDESLNAAKELMCEISNGVVDTISDQMRRNLISQNYVLPKIDIISMSFVAKYSRLCNLISINLNTLKLLSGHFKKSDIASISINKTVVFEGTRSDYMYLVAVEETKHSIDFFAGKLDNPKQANGTPAFEYSAQQHEYTALGEQVLLMRRRDDSSLAFITTDNYLRLIIEHRRKERIRS